VQIRGAPDGGAARQRNILQPGESILGKGEPEGGFLEAVFAHEMPESSSADDIAPQAHLNIRNELHDAGLVVLPVAMPPAFAIVAEAHDAAIVVEGQPLRSLSRQGTDMNGAALGGDPLSRIMRWIARAMPAVRRMMSWAMATSETASSNGIALSSPLPASVTESLEKISR